MRRRETPRNASSYEPFETLLRDGSATVLRAEEAESARVVDGYGWA